MSGRVADHRVPVATSLHRWESLTSLHWSYPPRAVAPLLPDGLEVDVLDGRAWVGLTPFVMRDVRLGALPPPRAWARFVEVNVRTYVRHPASATDGIWFLALLAPSRAVVAGLRQLGLPYVHAATVTGLRTPLLRACGLPPPSGPPHALWSRGVGVPRPSLP
ncbi:DUF2071 domain-containing protein [Cellulomonas sp. H30R-01]|uniref:DUF2071 domain-containing protein n=1 Tax=Cellulomonas sp. H30R-01 TaxID=2704467 RepID=UPI00138C4305|nr:DUF2071 domain-containing protein [Cellulomonas sp. H30R-01]QHT55940.1 DUF2071 domain-containing protein [Cellulomonas sp. H30R-01]